MSVLDEGVIDIFSVSDSSVMLTITDHLDWTNENEHLLALQTKINDYITYIETNQLYEDKPNVRGLPIVIRIELLYPVPDTVVFFFDEVRNILDGIGVSLLYGQNTIS